MKAALRGKIRRKRVPPAMSAAIQRKVLEEDWWAAAFGVGLYRALPVEPATDWLLADALGRGARVAVPMARRKGYRWGTVEADTRWVKGPYGVLEPERGGRAAAGDLRVVAVPGLAFDRRGGRLGHGGGHYDRLLSQTRGLLVGLCVEDCLVEDIPMERHDVPVDVVVTEKRICFAPSAARKLEQLTG